MYLVNPVLPARPAPRPTLRTDQSRACDSGPTAGARARARGKWAGQGRTIARRQPLCEPEPAERPVQANGGRATATSDAPVAPAALRHLPPEAHGRGGAPGQAEGGRAAGEWLRPRRPRGLAGGRRQRGALPLLAAVLHLLRPTSR